MNCYNRAFDMYKRIFWVELIFTQGSLRRSALNWSRSRVDSFSFFKSSLRASIHSSLGTTLWPVIVVSIVFIASSPLFMVEILSPLDSRLAEPKIDQQPYPMLQFILLLLLNAAAHFRGCSS